MTASVAQTSWRGLYRAAAWASLAYVILVLVPLALLFLAPLPRREGGWGGPPPEPRKFAGCSSETVDFGSFLATRREYCADNQPVGS